ncbi:hypothetical protein C4J96_3575 [Pseudomonas orientalis]|nr:hypothetical protein C4J96_3575 [Pseudomonas orientalis]
MTPRERSIAERAIGFAKANRTRIARDLACLTRYPGEEYPVSVFMAGSPGAGKTEVSKSFVNLMEAHGAKTLRIDPDDFRAYFPEYTGANSSLFQRGVTVMVERAIDLVYQQRQSFLLDGTLANVDVARKTSSVRSARKTGQFKSCMCIRSRNWHGNSCLHGKPLKAEISLVWNLFASSMHPRRRCAN